MRLSHQTEISSNWFFAPDCPFGISSDSPRTFISCRDPPEKQYCLLASTVRGCEHGKSAWAHKPNVEYVIFLMVWMKRILWWEKNCRNHFLVSYFEEKVCHFFIWLHTPVLNNLFPYLFEDTSENKICFHSTGPIHQTKGDMSNHYCKQCK